MKKVKKEEEMRRIAIVKVRGSVHMRAGIKETLRLLHIPKVNFCSVIDNRPTNKGMINKAKDYITWGEMDVDLFTELLRKWGRMEGNKKIDEEAIKAKGFTSLEDFSKKFMEFKAEFKDLGVKPVFRLHPPSKGFERVGIKKHLSVGGAHGYRGKNINALIKRMAGIRDGSKE